MPEKKSSSVNWWAVLISIVVGAPLLVVGYVTVQTWVPLQKAGKALDELDQSLGAAATYRPTASGEIPADRMERFLELRTTLVSACEGYGKVQKAFESIDSLEARDSKDAKEVGNAVLGLGGAALEITPFLARYFELRNDALLAASMGLQEYCYIYAVAYHDLLLAESTRHEIFSDDLALSPKASETLRQCLTRQLEDLRQSDDQAARTTEVRAELEKMEGDPARLIWQDRLPDAIHASVAPYREALDRLFCPATAGLEMERSSRRAIAVALE